MRVRTVYHSSIQFRLYVAKPCQSLRAWHIVSNNLVIIPAFDIIDMSTYRSPIPFDIPQKLSFKR